MFKNFDITFVMLLSILPALLFTALVYYCFNKYRSFIMEKYRWFKKMFFWNALIDTLNIGFINYVIWISDNLEEL